MILRLPQPLRAAMTDKQGKQETEDQVIRKIKRNYSMLVY
jgi:hypothetical protein